jgi:predicted RNA-binding Zn-ribbon protein involved in translation (DUF1610 family)
MNCYLCRMEAHDCGSDTDGQHVNCPDCGEYVISRIVIRQLGTQSLDYAEMREHMHMQRQSDATLVATINSETAIWSDGSARRE